jgi:arsenate reductase-like glutaredoxin family protein/DNA-directed RNA polymerase subunit RPC12/RpoP
MGAEFKPEFDFGNDQNAGGVAVELDFTGQTPLGKCPACGSRVFESAMAYVCEKSTGAAKSCSFRTGKIILQRQIDRAQVEKLLATGRTDLIEKFISKKGRPFKAFLVVGEGGKVGFEFEPRAPKAGKGSAKEAGPKEPAVKIDFTGQESLGKCPKCGGKMFEADGAYLCERSQFDKKPCRFKISKEILQQPIDRAQAQKLLATSKTDLLDKFISKAGKPFPAFLVMDDKGKVTFDFPPREGESGNNY